MICFVEKEKAFFGFFYFLTICVSIFFIRKTDKYERKSLFTYKPNSLSASGLSSNHEFMVKLPLKGWRWGFPIWQARFCVPWQKVNAIPMGEPLQLWTSLFVFALESFIPASISPTMTAASAQPAAAAENTLAFLRSQASATTINIVHPKSSSPSSQWRLFSSDSEK